MRTLLEIWKNTKYDQYESELRTKVEVKGLVKPIFKLTSISKENSNRELSLFLDDKEIDQLEYAIGEYRKLTSSSINHLFGKMMGALRVVNLGEIHSKEIDDKIKDLKEFIAFYEWGKK